MALENVDKECELSDRNTRHSVKHPLESVQQIVDDLIKEKVFEFTPKRAGCPSFPKFPSNILEKLDYKKIYSWKKDSLKLWASVYEKSN